MSPSLVTSLFGLMIVVGQLADDDVPPAVPADQTDFFERRVRPILAEHCWSCHGEKKQQAGLRLDSRDAAIKGSDNGPVLVPGKPDDSQLVAVIRHTGDLKMPPKGKLPGDAIAALTEWVRLGLPWPTSSKSDAVRAADAWKTHWAFQPVREPTLPIHSTPAAQSSRGATPWPRGPIDHFTQQRDGHRAVSNTLGLGGGSQRECGAHQGREYSQRNKTFHDGECFPLGRSA